MAILSRRRLARISEILSENLFLLHNEYRGILLAHQHICYDIEQFKCLYVPSEPLSLAQFKQEQEKKKNSLIYSLKQCSKDMHKNTVKGLQAVVEDLKVQVLGGEDFQEDEEKDAVLD